MSAVVTILLLKTRQKCFFLLPFAMKFYDLRNIFAFLYLKANSMEICEEISSFFQKNADVSIFDEIHG